MSQTQLNRYKVISKVIDGELKISEAAESLNLSERQIKRLKKGVNEQGVSFLIHKNTGRPPVHTLTDSLKEKIISLKENEIYQQANFLHFQELLQSNEGIVLSYSALYSILTEAGIKSPKKRRKPKQHNRRKRMAKEGLLIQMDATPYEWFGGSEKFSLHGAIDDATGKIVGLYICKNECLQGYFETTRQMLLEHGIPISIYADRHSIFRSPKADKISIEDQLKGKKVNETQFSAAMKELGVNIIPARSAQAKGRVERLWDTLQSRLPVEFKIAGVTTVEEANEFLVKYIVAFNNQFSVEARESEPAFRKLPDNLVVDNILSIKQTRVTDNGSVFSIYNRHFQIVNKGKEVTIPPKSKVEVLVSTRFGLRVNYDGNIYDVLPFIKPTRKKDSASKKQKDRSVYRPPMDHYFKSWDPEIKLAYTESNEEVLEMLFDIFYKKYA